jgi:hypothetical protein
LETTLITEKTERMLKEYELVEEAAIEQRVIEYRNEQNTFLEKRMQQAKQEQSLMIRQLLKANTLRHRTTVSSGTYDDQILSDTKDYQSSDENDNNLSANDDEDISTSIKPSSMLVGSLQQNNLAMLSGLNTTRVERLAQQTVTVTREPSITTTTSSSTTTTATIPITSDDKNSQMDSPLFEKVVPSSSSTSMLTRTFAQNPHSINTTSDDNDNSNTGNIRKGLLSSQASRLNEESINDDGMDNGADDCK